MPELPEVETVRKGLSDRLRDFRINELEVCLERTIASPGGPSEFIEMMKGALVGKWGRRGKYLLAGLYRTAHYPGEDSLKLVNGGIWGIHLRMTGHFEWHEKSQTPCKHTRVRFWNNNGQELRFVDVRSFGQMWWVEPGIKPEKIITGLKRLGPEPFSKEFNANYLEKKLKKKKRSIKSALLDQSLIAGVGNIYTDESLFSAGILPNREAGKLKKSELEILCANLRKILKESIGKGGTSFSDFRDLEGVNGNYGGQAWVYRRTGKTCRICGSKIKRTMIAGRGTHWCPTCQK